MSAQSLLPAVTSEADYAPWFGQVEPWLPAMQSICQTQGLDSGSLERIHEGSAIVFRCGEALIKLLPPFWREELELDLLGLQKTSGKLPVEVPEILGTGALENWGYLITRRLPGRALKGLWRELQASAQLRIMHQIGELISSLKQLDPTGLPGDWPDFVRRQRTGFAARQRANGLQEDLIAPFSELLDTLLPVDSPPVFLHCDLTDEHLLLEEVSGHWQITGLIDFGDMMAGDGLYELAAPTSLLTAGRPELRRGMIAGYGQTVEEEQLLAMLLLHRFCHLPGMLRKVPVPEPAAFRWVYASL